MSDFTRSVPVRFGQVDAAGIVFYPRYFEMLDTVLEDWALEVLGVSRRDLHLELGFGLPTVHLNANFAAASHLSDELLFAISAGEIGRSSIVLHVRVECAGELRWSGTVTLALVTLSPLQARPWPEAWRQALLRSRTLGVAA